VLTITIQLQNKIKNKSSIMYKAKQKNCKKIVKKKYLKNIHFSFKNKVLAFKRLFKKQE